MGRGIVWMFQVTNKRNLTRENLNMAKKGNLKIETKYLQITSKKKNNTIRTKIN